MMNRKGIAPIIILVTLSVLAATAWVAKPKIFHGETKRAKAAETAATNLQAVDNKQGAVAAASVVKIGEANAIAPDSPAKNFIAKEVPVALANLPTPDPQALIEAEKRKNAELQGRLNEANYLYASALKNASELQRQKEAALAASKRSLEALNEAAAAHRAAQRQRDLAILAVVAVLALYVYAKITGLGAGSIAAVVSDVKAGVHPIQALDTVTNTLQQKIIKALVKLKSPEPVAVAPTTANPAK